ncbi:MAG: hypothetical protein CUN56_00085 [Phototrophicales bacterium]|nr:MAG: hypothetical protein CUN56_00085 [Phototrophicales bacterium]
MTYQIDLNKSPYHITEIRKETTKSGKTVFNCYHPPLDYPLLQIFDPVILAAAGIDPNRDQIFTDLLIHWTEGEKVNQHGNPYKNATRVENRQPERATAAIEQIAKELQTLRELVTYLAETNGGRETLIKWYKSRKETGKR